MFQDKFHNSDKKSADIAALKKDIGRDTLENYCGENFILFITDINLTVFMFNELLKYANELLTAANLGSCEFISGSIQQLRPS